MSSPIQFFENLMSPKKEVREQAEKDLEQMKTMSVSQTINIFKEGIQSANENIAQLSALLLKKTYLDSPEKRQKLSLDEAKLLIDLVKTQINFQGRSWKTLQRLGDNLAPLYQVSGLGQGLQEIMNWFSDQANAISRKFAIYLIEVLCELGALKEELIDDNAIQNFKVIFSNGLKDADIEVKVSTLKAATQFLTNITKEETVMKFTDLAEIMFESLISSLKFELDKKETESTSGKTAIETLTFLIDAHPKFWKGKADLIIHIVGEICRTKAFPNKIRETALELVYSLCTNSPKAVKKSENFKKIFLPLLFELLLEVDNIDNLDKWEKQVEQDETDLEDMYYAVRDSFERLSVDLGGKFFMEATAGFIQKFITSQNWVEVHAGFTALGYMSEGCKDNFKEHLVELMNYISSALTHAHPRVRYSALFAFGAILKDTAPKPQKEFTNNILPALAKLMGPDEQSVRVKTNSCSCLVEFLRGLLGKEKARNESTEIVKPYSADLVKLCSELFEYSLKVGYAPLQEQSLTTLSLLSNILEKEFAPYYPTIMPGLKKLFNEFKAETTEQKTLKGQCIETISYLCASVCENPDNYMNDLTEISQSFVQYMQTLPEEDPQLGTLINSFCNLSLAMKDKFVPILDKLIPFLTKYINADIGLKIEDAALSEYIPEEAEADNEIGKVGSVLFNVGTQSAKLSLHTFALQNKVLAWNAFNDIATNMGVSFCPYIESLLNLSKELIKFPYSRKIRKISVKAILSAICDCSKNEQKKAILDTMGPILITQWETVVKNKFLKEVKSILKYLNLISVEIKDANLYTESFIGNIYQCLGETAKLIQLLKGNIITKVCGAKDEDEEDDALIDDYNEIEEILRRVMELNGNIFKVIGEKMTALVTNTLYEIFHNNWTASLKRSKLKSDQEILSAICFFDDYLQYSDMTAFNMVYMEFIDLSYNYQTENEDILQSLVYGYGLICKRLDKNEFQKIKAKVVPFIGNLIQKEQIGGYTKDNAIGAMGKYLYFQSNLDDNDKNMAGAFLKMLPLREDLEESKAVFEEFYAQIKANHPIICNDANIPAIKEVLTRIKELNDKEHFLEESEVLLREACAKFGL